MILVWMSLKERVRTSAPSTSSRRSPGCTCPLAWLGPPCAMLSIMCGCRKPVGTSVARIPAAPPDEGRPPDGGERLSSESPGPSSSMGSLPPDAGRKPGAGQPQSAWVPGALALGALAPARACVRARARATPAAHRTQRHAPSGGPECRFSEPCLAGAASCAAGNASAAAARAPSQRRQRRARGPTWTAAPRGLSQPSIAAAALSARGSRVPPACSRSRDRLLFAQPNFFLFFVLNALNILRGSSLFEGLLQRRNGGVAPVRTSLLIKGVRAHARP